MRKINTDLPYYIGTYSITSLIDEISAVDEDAEISWDSTGGSVWAGQKLIDFLNNRESKLTARITGIAASMGAAALPFFDYVIGAEQSDVMIHAARGGSDQTIKATNEFLYKALAKKINEDLFKEITGHNLKTVMLGEERIDVWITGKQAKKIGLYDETFSLLKGKAASLSNDLDLKELDYKLPESIKEKYGLIKNAKTEKSINNNEMEIKDVKQADLQIGNPSVYNAIIEEGKKAEGKRVAGIMKYAKYDMDKAAEMIEKGASMGVEEVEHFIEKKHGAKKVAELESGSEEDLNPVQKEAKVVDKKQTPEEIEKEAAWKNEMADIRMVTGVSESDKK